METVYTSKYYSLSQSDSKRRFYIDFGHKTVQLSFCQLLALRQKINAIKITDHFDADLNKHGFEILMLCNKEHLFILNTFEVIDLKELVLNSFEILHQTNRTLLEV